MEFKSELVDEWVAIWNSYDIPRVPELFLNDQRVTYFSSENVCIYPYFSYTSAQLKVISLIGAR